MSVTDTLQNETVHVRAGAGVHARLAVADALRLSDKTGFPVMLQFNGKTTRISWGALVDSITEALVQSEREEKR